MVLYVMMWIWLGIGVIGLVTDNDSSFIIGLVSATVTSVGITILAELKKKGEKSNDR